MPMVLAEEHRTQESWRKLSGASQSSLGAAAVRVLLATIAVLAQRACRLLYARCSNALPAHVRSYYYYLGATAITFAACINFPRRLAAA